MPPYIPVADPRDAATPVAAEGRPTFLFVGVPEPHKRPILALEAFAELVRRGGDAQLAFIGVHPPTPRAEIASRVAKLGLADRVLYLDRVDDADLARRYAGSVVLATSSVEGFGLPVVEAILAGGRVAATPTTAYLDAAGDVATFARTDSPQALADAMELSLSVVPSAADRMGIAQRFGAATVGASLLTAYRELVGA